MSGRKRTGGAPSAPRPTSGGSSFFNVRNALYAALLAVLIGLAFVFFAPNAPVEPVEEPEYPPKYLPELPAAPSKWKAVDVIEWEDIQKQTPDKSPIPYLAKQHLPYKLEHSPVFFGWNAGQTWAFTPQLYEGLIGERDISNIFVSKSPRFIYYSPKARKLDMDPRDGDERIPRHDVVHMSGRSFVKAAANDSAEADYVYLIARQSLGNLPLWMKQNLYPVRPYAAREKMGEPGVQVWLGREGIISSLHYDASYNVYVQLRGFKRFFLLPPSALPAAQIFPFNHPADVHSQLELDDEMMPVDPSAPGAAAFIAAREEHMTYVDLGPNDMLLIPPYWLHHVVSLRTGNVMVASVSLITRSEVQESAARLEKLAVPLDRKWPAQLKVRVLATLFQRIARELKDGQSKAAVEWPAGDLVLRARYEYWAAQPPLAAESEFPTPTDACMLDQDTTTVEDLNDAMSLLAVEAAAVFADIKSVDIRTLILYNYIDALFGFAGATPAQMPALLRFLDSSCWTAL